MKKHPLKNVKNLLATLLILLTPFTASAITTASVVDSTIGNFFKMIAWIIYHIMGLFMSISGWFMDKMIRQALDSTNLTDLTVIQDLWAVIRDIANMFFIFILLYIAIGTILRLSNVQWKQALANLIIVALLINFSFFFTRVIIDASNVLAVGFYNNITIEVDGETIYGPSSVFMQAVKLQTFFNTLDESKDLDANGDVVDYGLTNFTRGIIYLAAAMFQAIAGFIFISGGILFLIRFVSFIFLLILSPLAFVGMILQSTRSFASEWWSKLLKYSFVGPAYMGMIYIVTRIITSPGYAGFANFDHASFIREFKNSTSSMGYTATMNFLIVAAMMYGALTISQRIAGGMAQASMSWGKKLIGTTVGGGIAAGAIAGRQLGGRYAKYLKDTGAGDKLAKTNGGRVLLNTINSAATGTWDLRKSAVGGAATSALRYTGIKTNMGDKMGKGGYVEQGGVISGGEKRQKEYAEKQATISSSLEKNIDGTTRYAKDDKKVAKQKSDLVLAKNEYKKQKDKLSNSKIKVDKKAYNNLRTQFKAKVAVIKAQNTDSNTPLKDVYTDTLTAEITEEPKMWKPNGWKLNKNKGGAYQERAARNRAAVQRIKNGRGTRANAEKFLQDLQKEDPEAVQEVIKDVEQVREAEQVKKVEKVEDNSK